MSANEAPDTVLDLLQRSAALSARMLEGARAADWDAVHALEAERDPLLERVERIGYHALDPPGRARARSLIESIVRDNDETAALGRDWMASLRGILAQGDVRERIRQVVAARGEGAA